METKFHSTNIDKIINKIRAKVEDDGGDGEDCADDDNESVDALVSEGEGNDDVFDDDALLAF